MFGYKTIPLIQISELLCCDVSYKVERSINLLKLILDSISLLFFNETFFICKHFTEFYFGKVRIIYNNIMDYRNMRATQCERK